MHSTEHLLAQRRVRLAYELSRVRLALLGIAPVVVVVALALLFAARPLPTLVFGAATLSLGALLLWYGRDAQRGVLPGISAGIAPLLLALCASQLHWCGPEGCSTLCVPACALGGVIAGLALTSVAQRRRLGLAFWLAASSLALLTGAMGCSCLGYSGVLGMVLGYGAGLVPNLVRALR